MCVLVSVHFLVLFWLLFSPIFFPVLACFYFILLFLVFIWMPVCFLMRERKGVEDLGGIGGGETIIIICCVKENLFSMKGN